VQKKQTFLHHKGHKEHKGYARRVFFVNFVPFVVAFGSGLSGLCFSFVIIDFNPNVVVVPLAKNGKAVAIVKNFLTSGLLAPGAFLVNVDLPDLPHLQAQFFEQCNRHHRQFVAIASLSRHNFFHRPFFVIGGGPIEIRCEPAHDFLGFFIIRPGALRD
jgi:hypothetical protein